MELPKGRKRAQIVGCIDMVILMFFIFNNFFWLGYSCPSSTSRNMGNVSRVGNSRRGTDVSGCIDARNTTNMTFWANTTKVFFGYYFDLTVPYKMPMTGNEMGIYSTVDFFISFPLAIVTSFLTRPDRNEEVGRKRSKKTMPSYLALTFATGLGYAIWRAVDHAWVGLVVGGIVRTVLWVVVAQFYCSILGSSVTTENNPEDTERNNNVFVVATPVVTSF